MAGRSDKSRPSCCPGSSNGQSTVPDKRSATRKLRRWWFESTLGHFTARYAWRDINNGWVAVRLTKHSHVDRQTGRIATGQRGNIGLWS